jgi:hypothetical protein
VTPPINEERKHANEPCDGAGEHDPNGRLHALILLGDGLGDV